MSTHSNNIQDHLNADDTVLQTHQGIYNNQEGTLLLTKTTLLFLHEHGWRRKHYTTLLTIPYTQITDTTIEASHKLAISTQNNIHHIVTVDIAAQFIDDVIKHCMETLQLKDQVKTVTVPRKKRQSHASKTK